MIIYCPPTESNHRLRAPPLQVISGLEVVIAIWGQAGWVTINRTLCLNNQLTCLQFKSQLVSDPLTSCTVSYLCRTMNFQSIWQFCISCMYCQEPVCLILRACIIGNAAGWGTSVCTLWKQFKNWSAMSIPAVIQPVGLTAILYGVVTPITSIRVATPKEFLNTWPGSVKVNKPSPIHYYRSTDQYKGTHNQYNFGNKGQE